MNVYAYFWPLRASIQIFFRTRYIYSSHFCAPRGFLGKKEGSFQFLGRMSKNPADVARICSVGERHSRQHLSQNFDEVREFSSAPKSKLESSLEGVKNPWSLPNIISE